MEHPQCHEPFDFSAVEWAVGQPGADAAASFLGAFAGKCALTCQDRCRDVAAADPAATALVTFALVSTAITKQEVEPLRMLVLSQPVPARVRAVFEAIMSEDFDGALAPTREALAQASSGERQQLIEWWSNTAAVRLGEVRAAMQAFGLQ